MVHLADQPSDQLEDNLTNNSTNNIKYMNQNQINRLYKVAKGKVHNELEVMAKDKAQERAAMQQMYVRARNNYDGSEGDSFEQMDPSQFTAQQEREISGRPVPANLGRINTVVPTPDSVYRNSTPMDFTPYNPASDISTNPIGFIGSPREGLEGPVGSEILPPRNGPAPGAASKSGFSLDRFVAIVKDRARQISDMAGRGAQGISTLAQDPKVQIGAGIGAAGLAGYGIYKHLSKKDKKKDRAYA